MHRFECDLNECWNESIKGKEKQFLRSDHEGMNERMNERMNEGMKEYLNKRHVLSSYLSMRNKLRPNSLLFLTFYLENFCLSWLFYTISTI